MLGRETTYSVRDPQGRTYMVTGLDDPYKVDDKVYLNVSLKHIYFFGKGEQRIYEEDAQQYQACLEALRRGL